LLRRTIFGPLSGSTYRDTSDRRLPPLLDPDLYPRSRFPICRSRFSPRCDRRRGVSRRLSPLRRRRADARGVLVLRRPDTLVRLWHPVTLGVPAPAISGQVAWQKFPSPKDLDREAVALVKEQALLRSRMPSLGSRSSATPPFEGSPHVFRRGAVSKRLLIPRVLPPAAEQSATFRLEWLPTCALRRMTVGPFLASPCLRPRAPFPEGKGGRNALHGGSRLRIPSSATRN